MTESGSWGPYIGIEAVILTVVLGIIAVALQFWAPGCIAPSELPGLEKRSLFSCVCCGSYRW